MKNKLKNYRGKTCQCCGKPESTNPAHIQSKGAGGSDDDNNLLALCFTCHRSQHDKGWDLFLKDNPQVELILESKGWKVVEVFGVRKLKKS